MSQNELQERVAKLNTQLRFGRQQAALIEAYRLRTFIQISGLKSAEVLKELQRTENVIHTLEKNQSTGIQKLVDTIVRTVKRSMNPEDDTAEETLLDLFKEMEQEEDDFEPLDDDDDLDDDEPAPEDKPLGDGEAHW